MATAALAPRLPRPQVEDRLDEAFDKRIVLVVAGAGWGKSTAIAQWAEELEVAWLGLSAGDRRLASFAARLADVLRPWIGDAGDELRRALAGGGDDIERAETVAARLSEGFDRLTHDLVVVLDDAHDAFDPTTARMVEALGRRLSPLAHVVIASREPLDLRIERLRAQGDVVELGAVELAFAPEEIAALAQAVGVEDPDVVEAVARVTGGWPAGVRLMLEALRRVSADRRADALDRLSCPTPGTPLFDYLANEVFGREPPDVRELLRTAALLERPTVALCEMLGVAGAGDATDRLVQRGLFVARRGDAIELHGLAREFVRTAWPVGDDEARTVHATAAAWFEREGRVADALLEYRAAGRADEIACVLGSRGTALLAAGESALVAELVDGLPVELRDESAEQLRGEALFVRGDLDAAIASYKRARPAARPVPAGLAWRLGVAHYFRGSLTEALESFALAAPGGVSADDAILQSWASSVHRLRGNRDDATRLAESAVRIAERTGDDRALAAAYVAQDGVAADLGESPTRPGLLSDALAAAERCGDVVQLRRIRINRAAGMVERGVYEPALEEIEHVFALSDSSGLDFPGHALTNRGRIYLRMGRLDEAYGDYSSLIERGELSRASASESRYGFLGVADVHRERGSIALARTAYGRALTLAEDGDSHYALSMSLQGLARVLVDDDPDEARRLAQRAAAPRSSLTPWALNTAAWVALARGAAPEALELAGEARALAQANGDPWALAEALEVQGISAEPGNGIALLEESLTIWQAHGARVRVAECELALGSLSSGAAARASRRRAAAVLRTLGVRPRPTAPAGLLRLVAGVTQIALEIQAFGGFAVVRDGVSLPTAAWQSKKSRDLLKILVCRRGLSAPRDLLMEALWPGDDPSKLPNRLSVCLSTLRSVLDPERRFEADRFVKSDGGGVRLDLGMVLVDLEVFLREAETGLSLLADGDTNSAVEWLLQAESTYAGSLLADDDYAEWAVAPREEALATYLAVVHALAADSSIRDDRAAARYFLRVLGHDPYDERGHLGLVAALERSRQRGEARRAYASYVARMESIGVTPASFPVV